MEILRQRSDTREDLGLLAVMDALEDRERITQREIARQTGLNLKKVNYCLNKLLERGYVKFQRVRNNPDKRAYLYIMTPAGLKAKSLLTYRFIKFTFDFYNQMEEKVQKCLAEMFGRGVKRLVLYGASDVARILLEMADQEAVEIIGVVDDAYDGQEFHGMPVIKSGQLPELVWDGVLITVLENIEEAEMRIHQAGVAQDVIWTLP
ncbi:MAG: winged helix-turn-helix transcriptional regulator [bacterium]|nr:winged helix-turn-helix transcriptional regulator [bacterium]